MILYLNVFISKTCSLNLEAGGSCCYSYNVLAHVFNGMSYLCTFSNQKTDTNFTKAEITFPNHVSVVCSACHGHTAAESTSENYQQITLRFDGLLFKTFHYMLNTPAQIIHELFFPVAAGYFENSFGSYRSWISEWGTSV